VPGDDATAVTDTNLYVDSSRDSDITAEVAKDTPVTIVDGPITAADGTEWFWVRVWDSTGYMPAVDLDGVPTDTATETPADTTDTTETAPTRPWQEPIDYGVANDNVKCRVDVSTTADELIRVATGQTIEITGEEVWAEGIAWLPVNCAGVGGFIAKDFITLDSAAPVETEVATETPVETEVATETQVATETPVETEVATETPAETEVATEALTTTDAAAETETTVAVEVAGPVLPAIDVTVAIDDVVCRVDTTTSAPQITVVVTGPRSRSPARRSTPRA